MMWCLLLAEVASLITDFKMSAGFWTFLMSVCSFEYVTGKLGKQITWSRQVKVVAVACWLSGVVLRCVQAMQQPI